MRMSRNQASVPSVLQHEVALCRPRELREAAELGARGAKAEVLGGEVAGEHARAVQPVLDPGRLANRRPSSRRSKAFAFTCARMPHRQANDTSSICR